MEHLPEAGAAHAREGESWSVVGDTVRVSGRPTHARVSPFPMTYWNEMVQDMEDGNYTTPPGQKMTGKAAAAEGAAMLRAAFGTDDSN